MVIPGMPHHITQRGNRRQQTFFNDGDYAAYIELLPEWSREHGVEIWSYCLMPNHTHAIAVRPRRTAWDGPLARRTSVARGGLIFARSGAGISGKGGSPRS